MQKGVDAVAIGVIALGIVVLIVLFFLSNNMMPDPLPAVQKPDLASVRSSIENPLAAAAAPQMGGTMGGGPGMGGFGPSTPAAAPPAAAPPSAPGRGGSGEEEDLSTGRGLRGRGAGDVGM